MQLMYVSRLCRVATLGLVFQTSTMLASSSSVKTTLDGIPEGFIALRKPEVYLYTCAIYIYILLYFTCKCRVGASG